MKETEQQHIQQLLDRFMNGESTLTEEQELGQYFSTHEVNNEWLPFKEMFAYFDQGMPTVDEEVQAAAKPIAPAVTEDKPRKPSIPVWTRWAAAAMLTTIATTIGFNWHQARKANAPAVTAQHETLAAPATQAPAERLTLAQANPVEEEPRNARTATPGKWQHHATAHKVRKKQEATATSQDRDTEYNADLEMAMMQDAALLAELQQQMHYDNMELAMMQLQANPTAYSIDSNEIKEK